MGELYPDGVAYQRKRACKDLGYNVKAYTTVPEGMHYYKKPPMLNRIFWKIGFPLDSTKANKTILSEIEKERPSILWIEKGNTIWPRTLWAVRKTSPNTVIVSYVPDDVFASSHARSLFYKRGIKYYDFIFTSNSYNWRDTELPSLGAKRVVFVHFGYDPHTHRPVTVTPDDKVAFGGDVGFIGSYEKERADSLVYLAEKGIPVRVWGGGWGGLRGHHPNLLVEQRPLYGDEYAKGICATRINLGFLRKINRDLQTSRTFEIPACGGFMLAERTEEHLRLFEEDKEAAYFSSNEELLGKVRYYLKHEEERKVIAFAGRQRCLNSGYSHHERLEYMLSIVFNEAPQSLTDLLPEN